jgi:hypothetical protein
MSTTFGMLFLVIFLAAACKAWKDHHLLKTNPAAWQAMKNHEVYKKSRKRETLAKGGFALARWILKR